MNEDVLALIQKLVDTVETVAPQVWAIMLKQVVVNAVVDTVMAALFIIVACGLVYAGRHLFYKARGMREERRYNNDVDTVYFFSGLAFVVATILSFVSLLWATGAAKMFANPEYYAAMQLLEMVK
jgi:small-conductance mechanosensitive channel